MMRPMTALAHTSLGSLQGAPEGAAAAFRGVPYAAPPIGDDELNFTSHVAGDEFD